MKRMICVVLAVLLLSGCSAECAGALQRPSKPGKHTASAQFAPPEPLALPEPEPENDALVRVRDYIPNIAVALKYATTDNFTGKQIYTFEEVYLRYGTVKKLAEAQRRLNEQGLGILIWDGFRPVEAQRALWQVCPDPAYVSHPETGKRAHCRGNAVDLTLIDLTTGAEVEMPTGFDSFSTQADRDYSDCTAAAAENAVKLERVMEKCGFRGYWAEWWHYTDTEDYPVEETFLP